MPETAVCSPQELADAITGFVVRKSGIPQAIVSNIVAGAIQQAGALG